MKSIFFITRLSCRFRAFGHALQAVFRKEALVLFFAIIFGFFTAFAQVETDPPAEPASGLEDNLNDPALTAPTEVINEPPAGLAVDTVLMTFVRQKVIQNPDSLYFNVLKIENNTNRRISGTVKISLPESWNLITRERNRVNIRPGEVAYVPLRISVSRNAKGGVAFVVSASMSLDPAKPAMRATSYVTVPRVSEWKMYVKKRVIYFSEHMQDEKFDLYFENKGNLEEIILLDIKLGKDLLLYGARNGIYVDEVSLPPNSDTVLHFSVKVIPTTDNIETPQRNQNWKDYNVIVEASSDQKKNNLTIWYKYLVSSYTNRKDGKNTPLNIELIARNLLAETYPRMALRVFGTVLLPEEKEINYALSLPDIAYYGNRTASQYGTYLWQYGRIIASYKAPNYTINAGDIAGGLDQMVFGRGIGGSYRFNNNTIEATVVRSPVLPITGADINHGMKLGKTRIRYGITYQNDDYNKINSATGAASVGFGFLKTHSVNILLGVSQREHYYNDSTFKLTDSTFANDGADTTFYGYSANLNYTGKLNKFRFNVLNNYGSKYHAGRSSGRHQLAGYVYYNINAKLYTFFRYLRYSYDQQRYFQGRLQPDNGYLLESYLLQIDKRINPKLYYRVGPQIERTFQNMFSYYSQSIIPMETLSERIDLSLHYRPSRQSLITPRVLIGYTTYRVSEQALVFPVNADIADKPFLNVRLALYIKQRDWGVNASYYLGAYDVRSQAYYYNSTSYNKVLQISPFYSKFISGGKIKLSSYNNFMYHASQNSLRINLNLRMEFFLKKGWELFFNSNFYTYSRYGDEQDRGRVSNRNFMFDVGFRKAFDLAQPRVKYYDLKVVCYSDLNGNRIKEDNEPGLDFIVVNIERDKMAYEEIKPVGKFDFIEIVTDQFGEINYYNIPEGSYKLKFTPLKNLKNLYNVNGEEQPAIIGNNTTIYIPFVQANKVTGRIILIRDEYSSEGALSLSDVRITAKDTAGNTFTTLSDRRGDFTLFVPKAGRYKVTINNVFGEYFVLEQEDFIVDFDGYKEFQVVFKFMEKRRGINVNGGNGNGMDGNLFNDRQINDGGQPAPGTAPSGQPSSDPQGSNDPSVPPQLGPGGATDPGDDIPLGTLSDDDIVEVPSESINWEEAQYYIVIAVFNNRENALQFISELDDKTNALMIYTPANTYRVVYAYRTEEEARTDLERRRSIIPRAWISRKL